MEHNNSQQGTFGAASPELRELVKAVCEETLTPAQRDRLEELLRQDEGAQLYYLAHLDMAGRIQFLFRGRLDSETSVAEAGLPSASRRGGRFPVVTRARQWLAAQPVGALALLTLLACGVVLASFQRFNAPPPAAPEIAAASPWVATLGRSVGVEWDGPAPTQAHPVYAAGSELRMKKGVVEIGFSCGATMVLEGPAVLQFESDQSVLLHSGKMRADVPDRAIGFTVRTPRANIVDLGTAFGASVDDRGRTEVQVFKGKVDTEVRDLAGQSSRFFQISEGESLNIGEAREAVVGLSTNPGAFPSLPPLSQAEMWNQWVDYRKQLLQDKDLVGYWSFDKRDVLDLSQNHHDGHPMNSPAFSPDVPAALGGGLCLDLAGGPRFVQVRHRRSLDIADSLTVAFWVRGGNLQQDWARIISKAGMMNCSGWVIHRAADLDQVRTVVGNRTHCNQSIANVKGIYDGLWHHMAVVLNRGFWQVYVDGVFHSHGTYNHSEGLSNNADLIIGAAGEDQVMMGSLDFEGQIDELCLFRRPLSADEIRRICPVIDWRIHLAGERAESPARLAAAGGQ